MRDLIVLLPGAGPVLLGERLRLDLADLAQVAENLAQMPQALLDARSGLLAAGVSRNVAAHCDQRAGDRDVRLAVVQQLVWLLDGHATADVPAQQLGDRLHGLRRDRN